MAIKDEQLENLGEIRSLMERSTRFISLSGLSGVFAGIYALVGTAVAWGVLGYGGRIGKGSAPIGPDIPYRSFLWYLLLDAVVVLLLSLATSFLLTRRKARKKGLPFRDAAARRLMINMFLPLVTGGILCLLLFFERDISLVISLTLVFYGIALFNAGNYTLGEVRYLGIAEIICGIFAAGLPGLGLLFWILGFGFCHIFYGTFMYFRYDR